MAKYNSYPAITLLQPDDIVLVWETGTDSAKTINFQDFSDSIAALVAGTVTNFSFQDANGITGIVTNPTTTPNLTLTLGAITPTSVNGNTITTGSGVLTLGSGKTLNATRSLTLAGIDGKTLTINNSLALTGVDGSALDIGTGGNLGTAAFTSSSAYEVPLSFSTGLTRSVNTITANAVNLAASGSGGVTGNLPVANLNSGTSANATTFWRGDGAWVAIPGGGDVVGPGASINGEMVLFNGVSGAVVKRATGTGIVRVTSGVYGTPGNVSLTSEVTGNLPVTNLNSGTSAGSTTFWRGDGTWSNPTSSSVVSSQFNKTTDTTFANVTGLTSNVTSGITYSFEAYLLVNADVTGKSKFAINGTSTASSFVASSESFVSGATTGTYESGKTTTKGNSILVSSNTDFWTMIRGTIIASGTGTLTVQFAQQTANGTSSILVGSYFKVWPN